MSCLVAGERVSLIAYFIISEIQVVPPQKLYVPKNAQNTSELANSILKSEDKFRTISTAAGIKENDNDLKQ